MASDTGVRSSFVSATMLSHNSSASCTRSSTGSLNRSGYSARGLLWFIEGSLRDGSGDCTRLAVTVQVTCAPAADRRMLGIAAHVVAVMPAALALGRRRWRHADGQRRARRD